MIGPRFAGRRIVRYQLSAAAARRLGEALDVALDPVDGETVAEPAQPALVEQLSLRLVRGAEDPELLRALPLVGIVGVDPHCFFRIDSEQAWRQTPARDDEQEPRSTLLLLDETGSLRHVARPAADYSHGRPAGAAPREPRATPFRAKRHSADSCRRRGRRRPPGVPEARERRSGLP
ncbi:MAG TPA: hypothetical protein VK496_02665 [Gaiellaceae bacterium]|nr:hypothetical protein [Gaiellaceae bacterium]